MTRQSVTATYIVTEEVKPYVLMPEDLMVSLYNMITAPAAKIETNEAMKLDFKCDRVDDLIKKSQKVKVSKVVEAVGTVESDWKSENSQKYVNKDWHPPNLQNITKDENYVSILNNCFQNLNKSSCTLVRNKEDTKIMSFFAKVGDLVVGSFSVSDSNNEKDAKQLAAKIAIAYFFPKLDAILNQQFSASAKEKREKNNQFA